MTTKNLILLALTSVFLNSTVMAAPPALVAQQATGDCLATMKAAVQEKIKTKIDGSSWSDEAVGADPAVWPGSENVITVGFGDSNSCLNSYDVTIVPTAVSAGVNQSEPGGPTLPTATSCKVTAVAPSSDPIDCG